MLETGQVIDQSLPRKVTRRLTPSYPIARLAMEVRYRYYDHRFSVQTVEHSIGEAGYEAPSHSWFYLRT